MCKARGRGERRAGKECGARRALSEVYAASTALVNPIFYDQAQGIVRKIYGHGGVVVDQTIDLNDA